MLYRHYLTQSSRPPLEAGATITHTGCWQSTVYISWARTSLFPACHGSRSGSHIGQARKWWWMGMPLEEALRLRQMEFWWKTVPAPLPLIWDNSELLHSPQQHQTPVVHSGYLLDPSIHIFGLPRLPLHSPSGFSWDQQPKKAFVSRFHSRGTQIKTAYLDR